MQFVDIHGTPKNMAVPLAKPGDIEDILKDGLLFDGSSIEGFVDINESDLVIKPDPDTFSTLPWRPEEKGVCRFICDIFWPDGTPFEGDPRNVLKKSLEKVEKLVNLLKLKEDAFTKVLGSWKMLNLITIFLIIDARNKEKFRIKRN